MLPWPLQADDEPLLIGQLVVPPAAEEALRRCWVRLGTRSLYRSFEEYRQLVAEVSLSVHTCASARVLLLCCWVLLGVT